MYYQLTTHKNFFKNKWKPQKKYFLSLFYKHDAVGFNHILVLF